MKCQKGKRCVKQPGNALPILKGDKLCTGCNGRTSKDKKPKPTSEPYRLDEYDTSIKTSTMDDYDW